MLKEFIAANDLKAELIEFTKPVETVSQAMKLTGAKADEIVKSIVLESDEQELVLVVLLGADKIDLAKLSQATKLTNLRLAKPETVLEQTGYEPGEVPPISVYGIKTILDKKVLAKKIVWCGGGSKNALMKISVKEIQSSVDDLIIEDITQQGD